MPTLPTVSGGFVNCLSQYLHLSACVKCACNDKRVGHSVDAICKSPRAIPILEADWLAPNPACSDDDGKNKKDGYGENLNSFGSKLRVMKRGIYPDLQTEPKFHLAKGQDSQHRNTQEEHPEDQYPRPLRDDIGPIHND